MIKYSCLALVVLLAVQTAYGQPAAMPVGSKPACVRYDMPKQARQLCFSQKMQLMTDKPAAVTTPSNLLDIQASAKAACALLGKQYVSTVLSAMTWSTRPARCFNGQTTATDLVWTNLVCCPPEGVWTGPSPLMLGAATGLARTRDGRGGGRRNFNSFDNNEWDSFGQFLRDRNQAQFDRIAARAGLTTGK